MLFYLVKRVLFVERIMLWEVLVIDVILIKLWYKIYIEKGYVSVIDNIFIIKL